LAVSQRREFTARSGECHIGDRSGAARPATKGDQMTDERHLMVPADWNGAESLFECTVEGCGRRLVLDHVGARLVVVHPGSGSALHQGSTGLVAMSGTVRPGVPRAS